jgi:hypothetical protein
MAQDDEERFEAMYRIKHAKKPKDKIPATARQKNVFINLVKQRAYYSSLKNPNNSELDNWLEAEKHYKKYFPSLSFD